jgi:formate transporter
VNKKMDYVKPAAVVDAMIQAGTAKASLSTRDLLIRGMLSGGLLGISTSLALSAVVETGYGLIGALVFPVGFVMIVLLGLELVTGSFGVLPLAGAEGKVGTRGILKNLAIVFTGNLIGSLIYAALLWVVLTTGGQVEPTGIAAKLVAVAEAKTIGYAQHGAAGMLTVFTKAILCNWMVCMGVVMALTSTSTLSKIVAAWLPVFMFFAQGFEHSVVNMFVIPIGMLLGANVDMATWWLWNQIPVTLGNVVGGMVLTGLALYWTHKPMPVSERHLPKNGEALHEPGLVVTGS